MTKAILFDADGVVLKKQPYFSLEIAKENDVPYEEIEPFYKNELRQCQVGKADTKVELAKYLPKWKWQGSVDDFLQRWFTTDVHPDPEVLAVVKAFRDRGIRAFLASDQEINRGEYIRDALQAGENFDGTFFSYEVGHSKSDPEYYQKVLATLGLAPEEVAFWDDDEKNIVVAKAVGVDAHFYSELDELKSVLTT